MPVKTSKLPVKQNVGALVFIFAQTDGQFGIVSYDRSVESWGRSLDACWPKYFTKANRAMNKRNKEIAAAEKLAEKNEPFDTTPNASDTAPVYPADPNEFVET